MQEAAWQTEVARLLEQTVQALQDKADRRAVRAFGTAIAYLELARENGDKLATELLAQVSESAKEGPTERFTFQPGELEALSTPKNEPPTMPPRAAKKKKRR
ncbi:MAG TPA: hypothetical protein VF103_02395 [Polyangiaceae bacterium]